MSHPATQPQSPARAQRVPRAAWWFLLFPVLLLACVLLAAQDRSRRDQLESASFTRAMPSLFKPAEWTDPTQPVTSVFDRPLYLLNPIPISLEPTQIYPVGLEKGMPFAVYIPRLEEERLREDGTGRYFFPVGDSRFVEATDLAPTLP